MNFSGKSNAALLLMSLMLALGGCEITGPTCLACNSTSELVAATRSPHWTWTRDQRAGFVTHCAADAAIAESLPQAKDKAELASHSDALQTTRLRSLGGSTGAKDAAILIGGIHGNYRYFSSWATPLAASGKLVLGWDHDHRSMAMTSAAKLLAQDLTQLRNTGIVDVTIVAHSIGGLVAKGAIDELSRSQQALAFRRLDLHAFGSPWGGFAVVKLALDVPGSSAVSIAVGYPMARELRPQSSYLRSLAQPMPANGALHLYVGKADQLALPERSATRRRYAAMLNNAASVTTINEAAHNDYNRALTPAILAMGPGDGSCNDGLCNATTTSQRCATHLASVSRSEGAGAGRKVSVGSR